MQVYGRLLRSLLFARNGHYARNDRMTRYASEYLSRVIPSLRGGAFATTKQPTKLAAFIVAALMLILTGCASAPRPQTKLIVSSTYTKEKIKADGQITEAVWKAGAFTKISTKDGPAVYMKSVYGDKDIHFLLKWQDSTEDKVSKVWEFDGTKWKNGLEQDKLSILWDKDNSVAYFNINGCAAVCHTENKDKNLWYMATNGRREKTDLWFWLAGITNVYGFIEDRYLDDTVDPTLMKAARKRDQGDPGFLKNGYKTPVERIAPTRPTKKLIEGIPIDSNPYPNATQMEDILSYKIFKAGDKEPFVYFYGPPTGSAADVLGRGVWKDGWWYLEISRKLDTGHKDDMPFRPAPAASVYYMFGIAVFNHSEPPPIKHATSGPVSLELLPKP